MKCPKCGLYNPDTAMWCDCGYNFDGRAAVEVDWDDYKWKLRKIRKQLLGYGLLLIISIAFLVLIFMVMSDGGYVRVIVFAPAVYAFVKLAIAFGNYIKIKSEIHDLKKSIKTEDGMPG
jgi:hypothetical protein